MRNSQKGFIVTRSIIKILVIAVVLIVLVFGLYVEIKQRGAPLSAAPQKGLAGSGDTSEENDMRYLVGGDDSSGNFIVQSINQSFDFKDISYLFLTNVNWILASNTSLGVKSAVWQSETDTSFSRDVSFSGKEYFLKEHQIKEGARPIFADEKTLSSYGWVDGMTNSIKYKNYRLVFITEEAPYSGTRLYFRIKDGKLQTYAYKWNVDYEFVPCSDGICDVVPGSGRETAQLFVSEPLQLVDMVPTSTIP